MVDVEAVLKPVSPEAPCGPDLDAEGDLDYMNLMARIEGDLPASFFSFDRASIDFKADTKALTELLERSLDVRPVVALAKLAVLNRDLAGFGGWLATLGGLLSRYWADVHPAVAGGETVLRGAVLQTLDDLPTVVLPLQYVPLLTSRRVGPISFRTHLVASGEVARRDGEPEVDAAAIEQALAAAEMADLIGVRDTLAGIAQSIEAIRKQWVAEAGFDDAPTLERLAKLGTRMLAFLEDEVTRRAPQAALDQMAPAPEAGEAEAAPMAATAAKRDGARIASAQAAADGLAAVAAYLSSFEPSSPALLLVSQAQQLVGRSFVEIMQLVMPDALKEARITVGVEQQFTFKLDQLPAPTYDDGGSDNTDADEASAIEPAPAIVIGSRRDVQGLLDEIAAFYKVAEPSNPIPLLCERARGLCSLDFLTLMKDMIPKKK